MLRAGVTDDASDEVVRRQAFYKFLETIQIRALEAYPGIGPATISRLYEAGYTSLAAFNDSPLQVSGIGQKRLGEVKKAVHDLIKQARSRFESGACPEAHFLERQLLVLRSSRTLEGARAVARLEAAQSVVQQLEPLADLALQITLGKYVSWKSGRIPPPPIPRRALPNLHQAIENADAKAKRWYEEVHPATPVAKLGLPAAPMPDSASRDTDSPANALPIALPLVAPYMKVASAADLFHEALTSAEPAAKARPSTPPSSDALERLRLAIELAFAVARADGKVAKKEKAVVEDFLRRQCKTDKALFNRALALAARYESCTLNLTDSIQAVRAGLSADEQQQLFEFIHAVGTATGETNARRAAVLQRIAMEWNIPYSPTAPESIPKVEEPKPTSAAPIVDAPAQSDPLATLEIDPSLALSADFVRRQFNLLIERFAPEKFAATGPEFVKMAEQKRTAVRAAAESLMQRFGEPLEKEVPAAPADLRHNPDLDAMFGV